MATTLRMSIRGSATKHGHRRDISMTMGNPIESTKDSYSMKHTFIKPNNLMKSSRSFRKLTRIMTVLWTKMRLGRHYPKRVRFTEDEFNVYFNHLDKDGDGKLCLNE